MKDESSRSEATELEGAVLAVIARAGSMTAYAVKEEFRSSPSSFWSGSAGAVYPLLKRLECRDWVSSRDLSETKRPKREFRITAEGRRVMAAWLTDADRASLFLVDPEGRVAWVHTGSGAMDELRRRVEELLGPPSAAETPPTIP